MANLKNDVFKPIQQLLPKKTMIFYDNKEGGNYVEVRDIDENGKMLVGKPASLKTINFLKDLVVDRNETPVVNIDCKPNTFFWLDNSPDNTLIAWTDKPTKRIIRVGTKNETYYCPNTFWVYDGNEVHVYAYKKFRHLETNLYRLATPNVYDNGKICWGNSLEGHGGYDVFRSLRLMKTQVHNLFWNSKFNNHLTSGLKIKSEDFYNMNEKDQALNHIDTGTKIKDVLNALNKKFSF
tara:strand:+ start:1492 stop:2202 length:711 start_codon:yes stop_codon:yes gene_type:complete